MKMKTASVIQTQSFKKDLQSKIQGICKEERKERRKMTKKITSQMKITGIESLKRKQEQVRANGEEWGNGRPQKISRTLEASNSDQYNNRDIDIIDLTVMKEEEEEDRIVDKPTEDSNEYDVKVQPHLTSLEEPEPTSNFNFLLNLPDIPFNIFAMRLSIAQLRGLTQVSSSLKKRITENILENPVRKDELRARIRRAMKKYPSNEDISDAMWLGKDDLLSYYQFSL